MPTNFVNELTDLATTVASGLPLTDPYGRLIKSVQTPDGLKVTFSETVIPVVLDDSGNTVPSTIPPNAYEFKPYAVI